MALVSLIDDWATPVTDGTTTQPVTGWPPLSPGAVQLSEIWPPCWMAVTAVGAAGTVGGCAVKTPWGAVTGLRTVDCVPPAGTATTRLPPVSATNTSPLASTATAWGWATLVARVTCVPLAPPGAEAAGSSTTRLWPVSATKMSPFWSTATPWGTLSPLPTIVSLPLAGTSTTWLSPVLATYRSPWASRARAVG